MARAGRPVTVTLGEMQKGVEARVKSGACASASEVMRVPLRAFDREEAAIDDWLRQKVDEALTDARPSMPASNVFKRLREHHAKTVKSRQREEA